MKVINDFTGKHRFLSNFWACFELIYFDGDMYTSTEHAYQAAKTLSQEEREKIKEADTPGQAKRLGQKVTMRSDWDDIKIDIMYQLLKEKFQEGSILAQLLLETGYAKLIEGNTWGDTFWGQCKGKGENHLGKLLMKVRKELADQLDLGLGD